MARGGARARQGGFTLLEVMLAMTSLAMLTAIVYGAFHLGTRVVDKGAAAAVTAQRMRVASDVLSRQIKSMMAYPARDEEEGAYWFVERTPRTLSFVTGAGLMNGGGLMLVTYSIEDSPPRLLITENPVFSPDALGEDRINHDSERTATLLDGFRSMRFEYWDPDDRGGFDSEWQQLDHDRLPAAIKIVIEGLAGFGDEPLVQEIPVAAFEFSGVKDPEEMMNEEAEPPESATGDPAAPGVGSGGGETEQDSPEDREEAEDEDDDDSEEDDF